MKIFTYKQTLGWKLLVFSILRIWNFHSVNIRATTFTLHKIGSKKDIYGLTVSFQRVMKCQKNNAISSLQQSYNTPYNFKTCKTEENI